MEIKSITPMGSNGPIFKDEPVHHRSDPALQQRYVRGQAVVDKADKSGMTWAVVWEGALLPARFNHDDAQRHLSDLRCA